VVPDFPGGFNMICKSSIAACIALILLGVQAQAAEYRGVIRQVDPAGKQLTVEGRGKPYRNSAVTFALEKETRILLAGQQATVADLAVGKHVKIDYDTRDGHPVARTIRIIGLPQLDLPPSAPALAPSTNDPNAVAGTLRRVARTEPEIVVVSAAKSGGAEKETTIAVPESARILRDQKPIRYADLHEGESVFVHTEKKDGQLLAKSIEAGAVGAGPPPSSDRKIERLRSLLKMIDGLLEMADQRLAPQ
jgi:hypothetical protein